MNRFTIDGPVVVLPARICAVLESELDLDALRLKARSGRDIVVHDALQAIRAVALQYVEEVRQEVASDTRSTHLPAQEVAPRSESMLFGTRQVAAQAQLSPRAVTLAARNGRLRGALVSGRWWFDESDVALWLASRAA